MSKAARRLDRQPAQRVQFGDKRSGSNSSAEQGGTAASRNAAGRTP